MTTWWHAERWRLALFHGGGQEVEAPTGACATLQRHGQPDLRLLVHNHHDGGVAACW